MNTDIRIHVDFWSHTKVRRMIRHLGLQGPASLQQLWCYAAKHRSNGVLAGMDADDIEEAAQWPIDRRGEFVTYCTTNRWLDKSGRSAFAIHDWAENNPWAADAESRTDKARKAAHERHHKGNPKPGCRWCPADAPSTDEHCSEHATSSDEHCSERAVSTAPIETEHAQSNAPSPYPSPETSNQEPETSPRLRIKRERETSAAREPERIDDRVFTARAREIAKWTNSLPPLSDDAFSAAFEAQFEMTWDYWCALKAAMAPESSS